MAAPAWRMARLIDTQAETSLARRFRFLVPDADVFTFQPGQYLTLDLPISDNPEDRHRSYSIASPPDGSNQFELLIGRHDEGAGTHYLFYDTQPGTAIPFQGPLGRFTLPATLDHDLILVCTGTGIAPFHSMIGHIYRSGMPHQQVHLVFGTRTRQDLFYHEQWMTLQVSHPDFHYHPVLSRETWEGHSGYVHDVYPALLADRPDAIIFLCGWKEMITQARERMLAMGIPPASIHQELYG